MKSTNFLHSLKNELEEFFDEGKYMIHRVVFMYLVIYTGILIFEIGSGDLRYYMPAIAFGSSIAINVLISWGRKRIK